MAEKIDRSKMYMGVFFKSNGTWCYRIKRKVNGKVVDIEKGRFATELEAYHERQETLRKLLSQTESVEFIDNGVLFKDVFAEFLNNCHSEASKKKYKTIYSAQLKIWDDRKVKDITDADIKVLLLKISLQGKSQSYLTSIRKVIKLIFAYAYKVYGCSKDVGQFLDTTQPRLRVLSLFSGIGAPEQALRNLDIDYELVYYCEIDKKASKAYSLLHNVPERLNLKDITDLYGESEFVKSKYGADILKGYENQILSFCRYDMPDFDLMVFGFPCQSLSKAGKNEGMGDMPSFDDSEDEEKEMQTRSGLFWFALEIARQKQPMFLIAENVKNLITGHKDEFDTMLEEIDKAGYNVCYEVLNSTDFGIPQNRERVFIVMIRKDISMKYTFPVPKPKKEINPNWLREWLDDGVADECYVDMSKDTNYVKALQEGYDFEHKEGYIRTITTKWGIPSYNRQSFVKDSKGVRCLTSEELMAFQGFQKEQGAMLREAEFTMSDIGKLVGNSITVSVIQAVIEQLLKCM